MRKLWLFLFCFIRAASGASGTTARSVSEVSDALVSQRRIPCPLCRKNCKNGGEIEENPGDFALFGRNIYLCIRFQSEHEGNSSIPVDSSGPIAQLVRASDS